MFTDGAKTDTFTSAVILKIVAKTPLNYQMNVMFSKLKRIWYVLLTPIFDFLIHDVTETAYFKMAFLEVVVLD